MAGSIAPRAGEAITTAHGTYRGTAWYIERSKSYRYNRLPPIYWPEISGVLGIPEVPARFEEIIGWPPSNKETLMRKVEITKQPVELYKILKFEGLVSTGGEAKLLIGDGQVTVNGEVETRRRRKIVDGDVIEFREERLQVQLA